MGIFGSNYETRDTVGFIPLFGKDGNTEHDYWVNTVSQAYAQMHGEIDGSTLGSYLLQVNKYMNYSAYEKLGGISETSFTLKSIDEGAADDIVSGNPGYVSTHSTNYVGTFGGLSPDTAVYVCNQQYGVNGINCGDTTNTLEWSWNSIFITNVAYHVQVDTQVATIDITMSDGSHIGPMAVPMMIDAYNIYYNSDDGCVHAQSTPASSIEDGSETTEAHALFVRYKVASVINESKYITAINARIGIPNKEPPEDPDNPAPPEAQTMSEMLDDPTTIMYGITYAAKYEEPFIEIIDQLKAAGTYVVDIEGIDGTPNAGQIVYRPGSFSSLGGGLDPATSLACYINNAIVMYRPPGGEPEDNVDPRYIIPIEFIQDMNMMDKYDAVQNALCFVIHKQEVVHLKWYQTKLFQILMWVGAFAIAVVTQNPMVIVAMLGSTLLQFVNEDLALIVSIAFAVYSLGTGLLSSGTTMAANFANITKLIEAVSKYYFKQSLDDIRADILAGEKENEDIVEQLDEFLSKGIFMPLDHIGNYFDHITESLYNMYDLVYENENYLQLPPTTP